MKKLLVTLLFILSLFGCSLSNTPSGKVEAYLNKYNSLSDEVLADMETKVLNENLSTENRETYKQVLTRAYQNLKYEIKDESIDGNKAEVLVKITVYDLYKADRDSLNYMNEHLEEFNDVNNNFDNDLYNKYRLGEMLKVTDTVDYEIKFNLNKTDDDWVMQDLDRDSLEKIHGLYNYTNETNE